MRGWLTLIIGFTVGTLTFYAVTAWMRTPQTRSEAGQQEETLATETEKSPTPATVVKRHPMRPQAPPADHRMSDVPGYLISPETPLPTLPEPEHPVSSEQNEELDPDPTGPEKSQTPSTPPSKRQTRPGGTQRREAKRPPIQKTEVQTRQVSSESRPRRSVLLSPERPRPYNQRAQSGPALSTEESTPPTDTSRPEDYEQLLALQERYLLLGWRKFISVNGSFTVWVPGQLYYYLYADASGLELYHCEHGDILYGIQYRHLGLGERPSGSGDSRRFLLEQSTAWAQQYLNGKPGLQVDTHSFTMQDPLGKASIRLSVRGSAGRTQVKILLTEDAVVWFWTAYRNESAGSGRLQLLIESFRGIGKHEAS